MKKNLLFIALIATACTNLNGANTPSDVQIIDESERAFITQYHLKTPPPCDCCKPLQNTKIYRFQDSEDSPIWGMAWVSTNFSEKSAVISDLFFPSRYTTEDYLHTALHLILAMLDEKGITSIYFCQNNKIYADFAAQFPAMGFICGDDGKLHGKIQAILKNMSWILL